MSAQRENKHFELYRKMKYKEAYFKLDQDMTMVKSDLEFFHNFFKANCPHLIDRMNDFLVVKINKDSK